MLYMRQSLLAMLLVILSVGGLYSPAAAADTPKPTPTPGLKVEITPVATPITGDGKTVDVDLDQPFVLRQGQTGRIEAEDVSVTLRSLSEDSGCFSPDDCSTMLAEGTLAMQAGEDKTLLDFSASLTPDSPFTYEFGDYVIAMVHVEANEDGERLATFVISSSRPAEVAVPEPRLAKRCPGFSRFDAAAILQADVNPRPIANLVFAPLSSSAPEPTGLVWLLCDGGWPGDAGRHAPRSCAALPCLGGRYAVCGGGRPPVRGKKPSNCCTCCRSSAVVRMKWTAHDDAAADAARRRDERRVPANPV